VYGDKGTTFALPDLRGRVPVHQGQGPGRTDRLLGHNGGRETVTLIEPEMPSHKHAGKMRLNASSQPADQTTPENNYRAVTKTRSGETKIYASRSKIDMGVSDFITFDVGGSQPHENMPPFLVLNVCIGLHGTYPPHSDLGIEHALRQSAEASAKGLPPHVFAEHKGTTFTVQLDDATVDLELADVTTTRAHPHIEHTSVLFRCAPDDVFEHDTYRVAHNTLGTHHIALGPVLTMSPDVQYMEAVFSRFVEDE
jgi:microcystin-dependent protein